MNGPDANAPGWLDRLAHDLRGPLAPLQTASYLLRSATLEPERQAELFELIDRQTRRLARMIDEIGDLSRASQGRLLATRQPVEPDALLALALESDPALSTVAPEYTGDAAQAPLRGDPQRLVQMMRALAVHALARGDGPPRIALGRDGDRLHLDIEVTGDSGVDVDPDALLRSPLADPPDEGLGMQLMIAREIAEAHGGRLRAERTGTGLRLHCELPLD